MLSIVAGLTIGKPLGFALASALAVGLHLAERPRAYTWRELTGAGVLAGVGFTMSL
jgi:NhaA family Na+:H+ antiporter